MKPKTAVLSTVCVKGEQKASRVCCIDELPIGRASRNRLRFLIINYPGIIRVFKYDRKFSSSAFLDDYWGYLSTSPPNAWPPAAQAAIRPNCLSSAIILLAAQVVNRTPVAPNGCPGERLNKSMLASLYIYIYIYIYIPQVKKKCKKIQFPKWWKL